MKIVIEIPEENRDEITDILLDYLEEKAAYYTLSIKDAIKPGMTIWEIRRLDKEPRN